MAYTVPYAFDRFYEAVNLPGEHRTLANGRKDWIVRRLGRTLNVVDAFTIGSIPRYTALRQHADLDVLVVLHYGRHLRDRSPAQALATVKTALGAGAGSYRSNGQAVTMTFASWPRVDVVPAAKVIGDDGTISHFSIPDMNRGVWIDTDPREHARKMKRAAEHRGAGFRQTVTMVKHWNRRQPVRLQSYHIEVIALAADCAWDEPGWALFQWFQAAQQKMSWCWDGHSDVSRYLSWEQARACERRLAECALTARDGWYWTYRRDEHARAIGIWRSLLGTDFPAYG